MRSWPASKQKAADNAQSMPAALADVRVGSKAGDGVSAAEQAVELIIGQIGGVSVFHLNSRAVGRHDDPVLAQRSGSLHDEVEREFGLGGEATELAGDGERTVEANQGDGGVAEGSHDLVSVA